MALRNASLYFKKSVSTIPLTDLSNRASYSVKLFQNSNSLNIMIKPFQNKRMFHLHVSSRQNIFQLSKCLLSNNPPEKPNISRSKSFTDFPPPIDPHKINEALSESRSNSSKLKDLHIAINDETLKKESNDLKDDSEIPVQKLTIGQKIKNELIHYFHGFRLFCLEVGITGGILFRLSKGHTLTRRERKQLVRTVADLVRLAPFSVFIAVPFLELLLPLYIRFFPFMMPSTFQHSSKEAEKTRQLLKCKLEMAKFLQDTLEERRNINKYSSEASVSLESFNQFMKQVRESGLTAKTEDILKFSRLFEDEVTLESLDHNQLKALCKLLELKPVGPKAFLSFQLTMKVYVLKNDDRMIAKEGIDKLPAFELQQICRERGMRAMGVSEERLRFQLSQWIKLSIEKQVPISLLLLSRTMYLPDQLSPEQQLTKAILHLPEVASKEASLRSVRSDNKFDNKTKWELMSEEQKVIAKEQQAVEEALRIEKETLIDKAPVVGIEIGKQPAEIDSKSVAISEESISTSDLNEIESAIESISNNNTAWQEEELDELKEQAAELHDHEEMEKTFSSNNKLNKKLNNMIREMDTLLERLKVKKEDIIHDIQVGQTTEKAEERVVAISDLMKALKQVKSASGDDEKWRRILTVLDEDKDGHIELHHMTEILDMLGSEEVKLSSKEMGRLLDAIDKEEEFEKENEKEKLKKENSTK